MALEFIVNEETGKLEVVIYKPEYNAQKFIEDIYEYFNKNGWNYDDSIWKAIDEKFAESTVDFRYTFAGATSQKDIWEKISGILKAKTAYQLIFAYQEHGRKKSWDNIPDDLNNAVFTKFTEKFKEISSFEDITGLLEATLRFSLSATEDFSMKIIKHILGDPRPEIESFVQSALFDKPTLDRSSKFERYMGAHWVFPDSPDRKRLKEQTATKEKFKKLLCFTKSVKELREHGEKIIKEDNEKSEGSKGRKLVHAANKLKKAIPSMTIGGGETANAKLTNIMDKNEKDPDLNRHRGWRRVVLNIALCIGGFGIFYGFAVLGNGCRTGGKQWLFFNDTKTQKKFQQVNAEINAVNEQMDAEINAVNEPLKKEEVKRSDSSTLVV